MLQLEIAFLLGMSSRMASQQKPLKGGPGISGRSRQRRYLSALKSRPDPYPRKVLDVDRSKALSDGQIACSYPPSKENRGLMGLMDQASPSPFLFLAMCFPVSKHYRCSVKVFVMCLWLVFECFRTEDGLMLMNEREIELLVKLSEISATSNNVTPQQ